MTNLLDLVPSLVKQIPGGIQALSFADRFIQWDKYKNLAEGMGVPDSIETKAFLKLGLIKYAFNLPVIFTLEVSSDRISFREYLNHYAPSALLISEVKEPFEHFVSGQGSLGDLLKNIDEDLKVQKLQLERRFRPGTPCFVPYLAEFDGSHDDSNIAMWL